MDMRVIINTPRIRPLEPVLRKWIDLNESFAREMGFRDCPWWYNERTFVGVLAAACFLTGGYALEEYGCLKSWESEEYKGRSDLYLRIGGEEYACEAKHHWLRAEIPAGEALKRLEEAVETAEKDARGGDQSVKTRLALLFVAPTVPEREIGEIPDRIEKWRDLLKKLEPDAMAWTFPEGGERIREEGKEGKVYPGVALVLQEVRGG